MKKLFHIDELLFNEQVAGITTGDTKEKVFDFFGRPIGFSNIFRKLGISIFSYGNLQITLYENIVTGISIEPRDYQKGHLLVIDKNTLDILNSKVNFELYLKSREIQFYFERESIFIKDSHAFFSISGNYIYRLGLKDALIYGYAIK